MRREAINFCWLFLAARPAIISRVLALSRSKPEPPGGRTGGSHGTQAYLGPEWLSYGVMLLELQLVLAKHFFVQLTFGSSRPGSTPAWEKLLETSDRFKQLQVERSTPYRGEEGRVM